MTEYINGYALALFALAKEEKKLDGYKVDAVAIIEAIKENPDFIQLLRTKQISDEQKKAIITASFKKVNKSILNFMFIVIERSKPQIIANVLKKLVVFLNGELEINEGIVYSAEKLSPKDVEAIQNRVSKSLQLNKLTLVNKVDTTLVMGFRVEVGDEVVEDSVNSRLEQIKNKLLGKGN